MTEIPVLSEDILAAVSTLSSPKLARHTRHTRQQSITWRDYEYWLYVVFDTSLV
jgi:hypothetical protein